MQDLMPEGWTWARRLRVLTHPALLVVDEIGYLPVSQDGAVLFFQLVNGGGGLTKPPEHGLGSDASNPMAVSGARRWS